MKVLSPLDHPVDTPPRPIVPIGLTSPMASTPDTNPSISASAHSGGPIQAPAREPTLAGGPTTPVVTFIIPMFNAAATVGVTLGSLRMLKDLAWNAIVVDDGSTDGGAGAELVRHVASYDSRVLLLQKPNGGLSSARNAGIEHLVAHPALRGEFVAFLDSDDSIIAYNYPKLVALARETESSAAGHFTLVDPSGYTLRELTIGPDVIGLAELLDLHFVVTHCLLHRWVDLAPHRFDENLGRVEDYDMWFRMAQAGTRWSVLRSNVVRYRVGPSAADLPDPTARALQAGSPSGGDRKMIASEPAAASQGAMSRSFASMLSDGRKVVQRAYETVRANPALAATVDCSPERELRTLAKHAFTWATRTAMCSAEPGDLVAEPDAISAALSMATAFGSQHPGYWPRAVDGLAAAVRSSTELGMGKPFFDGNSDLSDDDLRFIDNTAARTLRWCKALISAGLMDAGALDALGFQLASAAMHPMNLGRVLVDRAKAKHDPRGPVIVFGFGTNGRAVVAELRKSWGGQIRVRDTRLSPDRPSDLGLVPVDCKLERWEDPVPDYAAVILSIADSAGPLSKAPLRDLPGDRVIRFDAVADLEDSVWVEATDNALALGAGKPPASNPPTNEPATGSAPGPLDAPPQTPDPDAPPHLCMILPLEKTPNDELMHLAKELLKASRQEATHRKLGESPARTKRPSFEVYLMPAGCPHEEIHKIEAELQHIGGFERVRHAHSHSHPAHFVSLCAEHLATANIILCPPHELSLIACQSLRTGTAHPPQLIAVASTHPASDLIWSAWPYADAVVGFSREALAAAASRLIGVRHSRALRRARESDGVALVARRLTPGQLKVVVLRPESLTTTATARLQELCRGLAAAKVNARVELPADGEASHRLAAMLSAASLPRSVARVLPTSSLPTTVAGTRVVDVLLYTGQLDGEFAELATAQGTIALSLDELTPAQIAETLSDRTQLAELQRQAASAHASSVTPTGSGVFAVPPAAGLQELCSLLTTEVPPGTARTSPVPHERAFRLFQVETDPTKPPYSELVSPSHSAWFMRDETALNYAGHVLETALAHHPARAAKRLMLFPPALRAPRQQEIERWQQRGFLPLAVHGLLDPLLLQRLARAMIELERPLVRAGRSPDSLRIAAAVADDVWAELQDSIMTDPNIVAIIDLPGQGTEARVRSAEALNPEQVEQGKKPVITTDQARDLILDGVLVVSPTGEPELVREIGEATSGRMTICGIFTDSWLH